MGNEQQRPLLLIKLYEELGKQCGGCFFVQTGRWLIENQKVARFGQGQGGEQAVSLAAGEILRIRCKVGVKSGRLIRKPAVKLGNPQAAKNGCIGNPGDEALKVVTDGAGEEKRGLKVGGYLTGQIDRTTIGGPKAADKSGQSGFARTAVAYDGGVLTVCHAEGKAVKDGNRWLITKKQLLDCQHLFGFVSMSSRSG